MRVQRKALRLGSVVLRRDKDGHRPPGELDHPRWRSTYPHRMLCGGSCSAEEQLAAYIASRYQPSRKERDIELIDIADVLSVYEADLLAARLANPASNSTRVLERLNDFWGARKLADVTGETCREYVRVRGGAGGARRDLEDLRAAINHHAKEGLHRGIVAGRLPPRGCHRARAG